MKIITTDVCNFRTLLSVNIKGMFNYNFNGDNKSGEKKYQTLKSNKEMRSPPLR